MDWFPSGFRISVECGERMEQFRVHDLDGFVTYVIAGVIQLEGRISNVAKQLLLDATFKEVRLGIEHCNYGGVDRVE